MGLVCLVALIGQVFLVGLEGLQGPLGLVGLVVQVGLAGVVILMCQLWPFLGIFWLFNWIKIYLDGTMVFVDPKEFDEPQVFDYPKGISIGNIAKGTTDPGVDCFNQ